MTRTRHTRKAQPLSAQSQREEGVIADLKPYSAMKDSGVPWLGEGFKKWLTDTVFALTYDKPGNPARPG